MKLYCIHLHKCLQNISGICSLQCTNPLSLEGLHDIESHLLHQHIFVCARVNKMRGIIIRFWLEAECSIPRKVKSRSMPVGDMRVIRILADYLVEDGFALLEQIFGEP